MRTLVVSPLCAVSVKAVESINAELRGGVPLIGRTSRRVSQSGLKKPRIQGFNRGPLPFDKLMALSKLKCVEGRQRLEGGATCGPLR